MEINNDSFISFEKYGRALGKEQKVHLKLVMNDGVPSLLAYTTKEMGLKDKVMSALRLGDFNTKKIVAFVSSDLFVKFLESQKLTPGAHKAVANAYNMLSGEISKSSERIRFINSWRKIKLDLDRQDAGMPARIHRAATKGLRPSPLASQFSYLLSKKDTLRADEMQKLLKIGEQRLLAEVDQGIIVVDYQNLRLALPANHWYGELSSFLDESQRNELLNKVMLHQELRLAKAKPGDEFASRKLILELICKKKGHSLPSHEAVSCAKVEALKALLKNEAALKQPPTIFMAHIQWEMHRAVLLAYGIPEKEISHWNNTVNLLLSQGRKAFQNTELYVQRILSQPKIQSLPPVAKEALSAHIKGVFFTKTKDSMDKTIERTINMHAMGAEVTRPIIKCILKLNLYKDFIAVHREIVKPQLRFFAKWQGNLKTEMCQGSNDSDQILGRGVCYALSLRWARDAIKQAVVSQDAMHTIGPKDRYYQAAMGIDPQILDTGSEDIEKIFGLQSPLREKNKEALLGKDQIVEQVLKTVTDPRFQHPYMGVAQILFGWTTKDNERPGHAITLVCQENRTNPEQSVFRFSDPNFGTFEFPVTKDPASIAHARQQCLSALGDLLVLMYSKKIDSLTLNCFRVSDK